MSSDGPGEVEYLASPEAERRPGGRRRGIVAAAVVGVLGVAAAGAWGVTQVLDGGTAAAAAVPADALAYVSLDLDPDADQKLEALRSLRKFPAIEAKLGFDSGDDVRRWLFEGLTDAADCGGLDFEDDVDPWLGSKVAVAVVPGRDQPVPFVVVEVKDQDQAVAGVAAIAACGDEAPPGTAFVEGFMVLAESDTVAEEVVARVEGGTLSDDEEFRRWTGEAGGDGIVTGYVAADAPRALSETVTGAPMDPMAGGPEAAPSLGGAVDPAHLDRILDDFEGAAMSMRFDDGALEVELAAGGLPGSAPADGESGIAELPSSTAVALGLAFGDGSAERLLDQLRSSFGDEQFDRLLLQAEMATGLRLPEDLQTLMGEGITLALDASVDVGALTGESPGDLPAIPLGVRISGDPDQIVPVLERIVELAGARNDVVIEAGEDVVAFGLDSDHVAALARDGDLGGSDQFEAAVPELDGSSAQLYVDFDVEDWLVDIVGEGPDSAELRDNLEPLNSLGVSGWVDDDVAHGLVRLSTD